MPTHIRRNVRLGAEPLEDRCVPAVTPHPPPDGPLALSGNADATGSPELFFSNAAGQYTASPYTTVNVFPLESLESPVQGGFNVAVIRSAVGDVNGDGAPDTILVKGPGPAVQVAVVSGTDNTTLLVPPFDPFGGGFTGGGFVAAGDFNNDGRADVVVTPDQGGGPRVAIFSLPNSGNLVTLASFFGIADPAFRGGARAAAGDVNGDGAPDLVVAAGFGGGPRVAVYDGTTVLSAAPAKLVSDFFAFEPLLQNGAYVAVGDLNGDGDGDIVLGAGPGGGPRVLIVSGSQLLSKGVVAAVANPLSNFFVAGDTADRGGVRVAVKNADGDDLADVAVGSGDGFVAKVYLGKNFTGTVQPTQFQDLTPFGVPSEDNPVYLQDGVYVG